jgi:hypothetical protein
VDPFAGPQAQGEVGEGHQCALKPSAPRAARISST